MRMRMMVLWKWRNDVFACICVYFMESSIDCVVPTDSNNDDYKHH